MNEKERVLTLASAARMTGVEQNILKSLIDEGKLEAVKTDTCFTLVNIAALKPFIFGTSTEKLPLTPFFSTNAINSLASLN